MTPGPSGDHRDRQGFVRRRAHRVGATAKVCGGALVGGVPAEDAAEVGPSPSLAPPSEQAPLKRIAVPATPTRAALRGEPAMLRLRASFLGCYPLPQCSPFTLRGSAKACRSDAAHLIDYVQRCGRGGAQRWSEGTPGVGGSPARADTAGRRPSGGRPARPGVRRAAHRALGGCLRGAGCRDCRVRRT